MTGGKEFEGPLEEKVMENFIQQTFQTIKNKNCDKNCNKFRELSFSEHNFHFL